MLPIDDPGPDATDSPREPNAAPHPSSLVMLRGEGRVTVTRRGPTLVACRLSGLVETTHVEWLLAELERQLASGATAVFVDASRLPALAGGASRALAAWSPALHAGLRALHVLGDDPVLAEPLESLARTLGDRLHRHHQPEPFLAALQAQSVEDR